MANEPAAPDDILRALAHIHRLRGGTIEDTVDLTFRVGPLGSALREAPDLAPVVREAVMACLSEYATSRGVLMPAAVDRPRQAAVLGRVLEALARASIATRGLANF